MSSSRSRIRGGASRAGLVLTAVVLLSACAADGYYRQSIGGHLQLTVLADVLGRENHFAIGAAVFEGRSLFASQTELSRLDPLPPGTYDITDEKSLSTLVATAFMQRRKTLRNSLRNDASAEDFAAAKRRLDPQLTFRNNLWDSYLGAL